MIRAGTILDQDKWTEDNCGCMYSVHRAMSCVNNRCEFQHSSSHDDCTFDARGGQKKRGGGPQKKAAVTTSPKKNGSGPPPSPPKKGGGGPKIKAVDQKRRLLRFVCIGPPTASLRRGTVYRGCPAGTHRCDDSSRVTSHQSANPWACGWCWAAALLLKGV